MLLDYLTNNYSPGEPIFSADINLPEFTDANIRYHFKRLTDNGILRRYSPGVYYIPKTGKAFGEVPLASDIVIKNKYILRQGKTIGYYSGNTLINLMGLSSQVPFVIEIASNNAPAPVRKFKLKSQTFIIRKPRVSVDDKNVNVLMLLECLSLLDKCAEISYKRSGRILTDFISKTGITKKSVDNYIGYYPLKVYKAIYDTNILLI